MKQIEAKGFMDLCVAIVSQIDAARMDVEDYKKTMAAMPLDQQHAMNRVYLEAQQYIYIVERG